MKYYIDPRKAMQNNGLYKFMFFFTITILAISLILNMPKPGIIIIIVYLCFLPIGKLIDKHFSSDYDTITFSNDGFTIKKKKNEDFFSWADVKDVRRAKKLIKYQQHGFENLIAIEIAKENPADIEIIYIFYLDEVYDCALECFEQYKNA